VPTLDELGAGPIAPVQGRLTSRELPIEGEERFSELIGLTGQPESVRKLLLVDMFVTRACKGALGACWW